MEIKSKEMFGSKIKLNKNLTIIIFIFFKYTFFHVCVYTIDQRFGVSTIVF